MDFKLSPAQADPHHQGEVVVLAAKDWTDAEDALSKLAHVASDRRRGAAASDFSAGPRLTEPSLDAALGRADAKIGPLPADRPSLGRRASHRVARFVLTACVGVAATLSWQSYGGPARQMIASSAPQLGWLLLPATNAPSGGESTVEQPSPAIQASAPPAAASQSGAVTSNAPEAAVSAAPTGPSLDVRQLEALSHDLAAVRESVEQLAAGQEQIARELAKLQTEKQDLRRRTSALPSAAATARKPVPPPQPAVQTSAGPPPAPAQPAPQSAVPPLASAPPPPGPALAAPLPPPPDSLLRPPMPVR